jgi:hypothetical protein
MIQKIDYVNESDINPGHFFLVSLPTFPTLFNLYDNDVVEVVSPWFLMRTSTPNMIFIGKSKNDKKICTV